jgi:copper chaperone NosL
MKRIIVLFLLLTAGCVQEEEKASLEEELNLPEPVDIEVGVDMCAQCGMKIGDPRFAGEIILEKEVKKFDDIGCLFLYYITLDREAKEKVLALYVQDNGGRGWINAERAHYVYSREVDTPMGYGIVAFATLEDALTFAELHGSREVLTLEEAVESFGRYVR